MTDFLHMFIDFFYDIFDLVNSKLVLNINGIQVQYFYLVLGFVIVAMVISVFWKGVKA